MYHTSSHTSATSAAPQRKAASGGSSGAAQTAQGALEAYLQSQIENNRDYRPGEIPKLEDAVLRQEGSTVLLAVSADTPAVEALLG